MRYFLIVISATLVVACAGGFHSCYSHLGYSDKSMALTDSLSLMWQSKLKGSISDCILVEDSLALLGDSRGGLTMLDLRTGERVERYWRPFKRPIYFAALGDSLLFIASRSEEELLCWDFPNSRQKWKIKIPKQHMQILPMKQNTALLLQKGIVLIDNESGKIGKMLTFSSNQHAIALADSIILAIAENGVLKQLDCNLTVIDSCDSQLTFVQNACLTDDYLLLNDADGTIVLFDYCSCQPIFKKQFSSTLYSRPQLLDSDLIIPFADGRVIRYSMANDSLLWAYRQNSLLNLDLQLSERSIFAPYARGIIAVLNKKSGKGKFNRNMNGSIDFAKMSKYGLLVGQKRKLVLLGAPHAMH